MTIKTYWALSEELSGPHAKAVDAQRQVERDVIELVKTRTGCDAVFFGSHGQVYPGFKVKPTDTDTWMKKPSGSHREYTLMSAKSKTDAAAALSEAREMIEKCVRFDAYCKSLWPTCDREVMGSGMTPTQFVLTKTVFGFLKRRVVVCVPFTDDEVIDRSIIPSGFTELTVTEYAELQRARNTARTATMPAAGRTPALNRSNNYAFNQGY